MIQIQECVALKPVCVCVCVCVCVLEYVFSSLPFQGQIKTLFSTRIFVLIP